MLSKREEEFIVYWEKNRDRNKLFYQLILAFLPVCLFVRAYCCLDIDWYQCEYGGQPEMNPFILLIAIVAIAVFMAIFL